MTFFSSSTFSSPSTAVILTIGSECAILGKKKSLNFISSPPFMPDQAQTAGPVICGYATISVRRCSAFYRTSGSESSWAIRLISSVLCIFSMARMQLPLSFPPGGLNAPATILRRISAQGQRHRYADQKVNTGRLRLKKRPLHDAGRRKKNTARHNCGRYHLRMSFLSFYDGLKLKEFSPNLNGVKNVVGVFWRGIFQGRGP
ncbi:MAG: hypothetical protein WAV08_13225, partial [Desulfobacterales bacterium]